MKSPATFGGSLFADGPYFWHVLTPVKFYHHFRRVATFKGLLLLELNGSTVEALVSDQLGNSKKVVVTRAYENGALVSDRMVKQ